MKKLIVLLFSLFSIFFLGFSFGDDIVLQIPDKYFNNTPAISSNRSQISFSASGNQGFGVFFLGTGTPSSTTLTLNGNSISCSSKLNGFYTINFTNFSMFPLDSISASNISDPGIKLAQGGLFYNCKKGNTNYTGVYGFIRRNYGANLENTHEIRAGINPSTHTRTTSSPLQLIYSDNFRNSHRALSGSFYTNLASFSNTTPHFFGDIRLSSGNTILTSLGSSSNPYYLIDQNAYDNNQIKVIIASSHIDSATKSELTLFDTNGQIVGKPISGRLTNGVAPFGFNSSFIFSLKDQVDNSFSLSSGTIDVEIHDNNGHWNGQISFRLTGSSQNPNFQVLYNPNSCTSGAVQVSVSGANISSYKINGQSGPVSFTSNQTGVVDVSFSNNSTGSAIFDISWIDKTGANIVQTGTFTGYECSTITGTIMALDSGCGSGNLQISFDNGATRKTGTKQGNNTLFQYSASSTNTGTSRINFTIKDLVGNTSTGYITLQRQNKPITGKNFDLPLSESGSKYIASGNWKTLTNASAGICETNNIYLTGINCNKGIGRINGDHFYYEIDGTQLDGDQYCTFRLGDGDGEITITGNLLDCANGNNSACKLAFQAIIISGEKFVDYNGLIGQGPQPDPNRKTVKYTSGSNITIQITSDSEISKYRVSCIPQENYCSKLEPRHICSLGQNSNICILRNQIIQESSGYACTRTGNARSNRQNFPQDGIFQRDLESGNEACKMYQNKIPYSKYQGERQVRIQVQDTNDRISQKIPTDPVIYSKEKPTIANSPNITFTIDVKGGQLDNGVIENKYSELTKEKLNTISNLLHQNHLYSINKDLYNQRLIFGKCSAGETTGGNRFCNIFTGN